MERNKVTYLLLSIIAIMILASCGTADSSGSNIEPVGDLVSKAEITENDGAIDVNYTVINTSEKDLELTFSSSLKADYIVYNEAGEKVLQYSDGKMYSMALESVTIKQSEKLVSDFHIDELPPGTYSIELFLNASDHNAKIIEEFTVTL